ncbi:MAG: trypsin-like peptidase domain-containing protein [Deltaproteobacteria bacterium]|nr:trypsin-like peptidase domain-containing protein [Deltaproteobacteria bacterium]
MDCRFASRCLVIALGLSGSFPRETFAHPHSEAVVEAVKRAGPAVVSLFTDQVRESPFSGFMRDPWFDEFGFDSHARRKRGVSLGSGVVVDPRGFVLTNEHVVARAGSIRVVLADGRELAGELVAGDAEFDIAIIRVRAPGGLASIPLGRSSALSPGESVIAIGNPFGLSHTVTVGVVSALGRALKTERRIYRDLIQTDASINPGNSGGPLLNLKGEIVGINTAIYQSGRGIGFAIPIDRARRIVDDLLQFGEVVRGWLGFDVRDVEDGDRARVVVVHVEPGSPAEKAGVRRGDWLAKLRDEGVASHRDFSERIRGVTVGELVSMVMIRGSAFVPITVTAGRFPANRARDFVKRRLGFVVRAFAREGERAASGVVISGLVRGGLAQRVGLRPGDRVLQIANASINKLQDFEAAVARVVGAKSVLVLIQRGRLGYYVTLPL